jgi:hypothetical protein
MRYCIRTILTTFYHMHYYHYAATGDMVKSLLLSKYKVRPYMGAHSNNITQHYDHDQSHKLDVCMYSSGVSRI